MHKPTTKVCKCGNTLLVSLTSLNKKYCTNCHKYIDWYLDEGQKSPLTSNIGGLTEESVPLIKTIQSNIPIYENKTLSAENPMLPVNTFFIPLSQVSKEQIQNFCSVFGEFYHVDVPRDFVTNVYSLSTSTPNVGILVNLKPPQLAVVTTKNDADFKPYDISLVTTTLQALINILDIYGDEPDFEPEPEINTDTESSVKAPKIIPMTVLEAARAYQELYPIITSIGKRIGLNTTSDDHLENAKYVLQVLEQYYTPPTFH